MYLEEVINKLGDKKIDVYLDMDGTIAHYDVGVADNFDTKRPLFGRIDKIKYIINNYPNVTFKILSIGNLDIHKEQKNKWLDEYIPEIKSEDRNILIRYKDSQITSALVKKSFINNLKTTNTIMLIDDDPRVLGAIKKDNKNNILLYKDSILSD